LPTGVNLSSLGLSRGQNLRLHNLVSLANVQGASNQCIALPISLMMTPNNSAPNNAQQQTINSQNVVVGLTNNNLANVVLDNSKDHSHQNTNQQQNLVLINNIDHTNNPSIAYQPQTSFSIGGLGSLQSNLQTANLSSTGNLQNNLNANLKMNDDQTGDLNHLHFTNYSQHQIVSPIANLTNLTQANQQGQPIAIQIATPNSIETQQAAIAGSQVQLTLQKNN
jgi:hypothetical protein